MFGVCTLFLSNQYDVWLRYFLCLAVTISVVDSLLRRGLRLQCGVVQALSLSQGYWCLMNRAGEWQDADLVLGSHIGTWITVARFRTESGVKAVALAKDTVAGDQFRHCYVHLRFDERIREV